MRILLLTQWFQPEPFFKGLPFARALKKRGHEVEVLTGFPNYPGGKLYPGYRVRLLSRERVEGIRVNRVALYPSHDRSGFRRILNYLSFGLSSFLLGPAAIRRPDVVYVYNLVTLGLTSSALRRIYRCPVVHDVQDLWPDSVADSGMMGNPFLLRVLKFFSNRVYRAADRVAVLSPGMKAELCRRGVPAGRISVLYNWGEESALGAGAREEGKGEEPCLAGKFTVLFAGTMGTVQGLDRVLDAAAAVRKEEPKIRFLFVGGGVERDRLERDARERGLDNVSFLGRRPPEEMKGIFEGADVLLVHLKDRPLFRITIPSKIQAYLLAGKPILAAVRGDAARLVLEAGAGVAAEPENPESIARGVLGLFRLSERERAAMGSRGKAYYEKFLSLEVGAGGFAKIFEELGTAGTARPVLVRKDRGKVGKEVF